MGSAYPLRGTGPGPTTNSPPDGTVPKRLEHVAEWLATSRPDILTTPVLAKDWPVGTAELLLVYWWIPGQRHCSPDLLAG